MQAIDRYNKFKDEDFDKIIVLIKSGTIKCGRYARLVKFDPKKKIGEEIFKDG